MAIIMQTQQEQTEIIRLIRTIIRQQQLAPGEKIGTERELCEKLNVTRSSLCKALSKMEHAREIKRLIGRHGGIFVDDAKLTRNIDTIESLPEIARRQGRLVTTNVLSATVTTASTMEVRHLHLTESHVVYHLTRLRYLDGIPLSIEQSALPSGMFPQLLAIPDFGRSLYGTLQREYGISPTSSNETVDVVSSGPGTAGMLEVAEDTPLIQVHRDTFTEHHQTMEHAVELFISSRIRFTLQAGGYVRPTATSAA